MAVKYELERLRVLSGQITDVANNLTAAVDLGVAVSAPELLAALKVIRTKCSCGEKSTLAESVYQVADAAIRLAEGGVK